MFRGGDEMIIYTARCVKCSYIWNSSNGKYDLNPEDLCYACKDELIKGSETLNILELTKEQQLLKSEIKKLQEKILILKDNIERKENEKRKGKKILIALGLLTEPYDRDGREELRKIDIEYEEVNKRSLVIKYILQLRIPQAQVRYRQKEALKLHKRNLARQTYEQNLKDVIDKPVYKREEFRIREKDYKRGNTIENYVRNKLRCQIYQWFNNQCIVCQSQEDLTLDHYWLSNNAGGNLIMYHHSKNILVSNVVVLCRSCNSAKSDYSYNEFFTEEQKQQIDGILYEMNKYINQDIEIVSKARKWYAVPIEELKGAKIFSEKHMLVIERPNEPNK